MESLGQTRSNPNSEEESLQPVEKKPRLESPPITECQKDTQVFPTPALVKSAKKDTKRGKKRRRDKQALPELYSNEDVLWRDVVSLIGQDTVNQALVDGSEFDSPFEFREEVELDVSEICSSGEGLAVAAAPRRPWVVVVPFALPGEKIRARVYRSSRLHSFADLVSVVTPNTELRDPSRVQCKHFGLCAGCQYQMLSYETQLDLKRNVVVKAFKNFSDLPDSSIPTIGSTIPSPLQYGYRTKITPHFDAPPKKSQKQGTVVGTGKPDWLKIGFNQIGTKHVMDIEECPIATPVLNEALVPIRDDIIKNIHSYKKGVSLLLRDSLDTSVKISASSTSAGVVDALSSSLEKHICITDQKATVREKVGDLAFEYPAGSFFQNNNSVLGPLTKYVRDAIFPSTLTPRPTPTHLVDAYCGSGLFALTLASHFTTVAGIELSTASIRSATHNAVLNKISPGKCTFRAGDAANIFATVSEFPPAQTVLVIDPPRKGCDTAFIEQLVRFRCAVVVYVSCNVHTQARDVGDILRRTESAEAGGRYVLESLRGFDLFPQTAHVESIAVLRLV